MMRPFWIYDDPAKGLALVRGDVHGLLDEVALLDRARWSSGGRGWVLQLPTPPTCSPWQTIAAGRTACDAWRHHDLDQDGLGVP